MDRKRSTRLGLRSGEVSRDCVEPEAGPSHPSRRFVPDGLDCIPYLRAGRASARARTELRSRKVFLEFFAEYG